MTKTITPSAPRTAASVLSPGSTEKKFPINQELRDQLRAYQNERALTNVELGRELGYPDSTVWSKYFNDNMDRPVKDFEDRARSLLKNKDRRRTFTGIIVPSNVIEKTGMFIDRCLNVGKPGVFTGEAGIGKTVGIQSWYLQNPQATVIKANAIQNDARGVMALLWAEAGSNAYSQEPRYNRLVARYKGSRVPIVVDGAQRLGAGGRALLFDLFDDTGCPPVLIGNPIIFDQLARVDQDHSRTHLAGSAELKNAEVIVPQIISQYLDDPEPILDLALQIVARPGGGHLRTLENLLAATLTLMELNANRKNPRKTFEKALAASVAHRDLAK